MNISFSFVKGLSLGLEYVDLDEDDQAQLETDGNIMVILSLGFLRVIYMNGGVAEDEE